MYKGTFIFLSLIFGPLFVWSSGTQVVSSQVGEALHFEFLGQTQWDYDLNKKEEKGSTIVELLVPRLSEGAIVELKAWKNPLVSQVQIRRGGPDQKDMIIFKINGTGLDAFDYLTDQPSRLIVDIFPSPKKTATKPSKKPIVAKNKTNKINKKIEERKPAGDTLVIANAGPLPATASSDSLHQMGIYDGGDPNFSRFRMADYEIKEEAIIASRENYYIEFPMLRMDLDTLERIQERRPQYEIEPKETDENKQARLLQTLFEKKRYHVFLKTVDWFYQKYPNSQYDEVIRFMWADTLFALWMENHQLADFDHAMLRYRTALEKYPQSPLMERTLLLMGFAALDRGDYFGTLRQFESNLRTRPSSPNLDLAHLAIAEAYLKLNRYDEALKVYDQVEATASQAKFKMKAAYLRGDIYFQKKDYNKAIDEYSKALSKYSEGAADYPNAYYNKAGSYFGLHQYRNSLESYVDFLKQFPNHSFAGYAMTRIGELLEILGADRKKVMGAYLETYFRYGETPSSVVARLRFLSGRMKEMKPKELARAIQDIADLAKKSELPKIDQFATVITADGYSRRGDYDKAIDLLIKYYQANPTSADTQLLTNNIVKDINEKIRNQVEEHQFIEALKTHEKYVDNWLKGSDRIDTKYNVGQAYEQAGVFSEADSLYKDVFNKILSLKGTQAGKERNIFEKLPSVDLIHLRLAACSAQLGKFSDAYDYLKQIKNPEQMPEAEQVERVHLASLLLEKKGDYETASRYLVDLLKTWKGLPLLLADPYLTLGEFEVKLNRKEDAMKSFAKVDELMQDSGVVNKETHAKALEKLANLQLEAGQTQAAIETYSKLLEKYEADRPLSSLRYKLGQIYFKKGEIQKAADVWNKFKGPRSEFWSKLAKEQLQNSEWNDEYKKYIKRIPAMSERN